MSFKLVPYLKFRVFLPVLKIAGALTPPVVDYGDCVYMRVNIYSAAPFCYFIMVGAVFINYSMPTSSILFAESALK